MHAGLPRMAGEAPPGYVAFVARHLEPLRRDAALVVGDERDADLLYPDVLADVAARWSWLELMRTRLGRSGAADSYLRQAFARRCERWQVERLRTDPESLGPVDVQVLRSDEWLPMLPLTPRFEAAPTRSNAAARLAPFLRAGTRAEVGPLAEAAIAWWHAYEAYRRRLAVAGLVALFLLTLFLLRFQQPA
jgi:hypothetical protein